MERRRVVVTGMGVVSPVGIGVDAFWNALLSGKSGVTPITEFDATDFPVKIAGEVKDFDPVKYVGDKKTVRHMDRNCLLYTSPSPRDGLLSRMPSSA